MKRRVSLLLVLAMLLSMLPLAVSAAEATVLHSVTNESVTTSGYTFTYTAETAGTLNVTVGECNPGWRYKITTPDGTESLWRKENNATANCDYAGDAGNWTIKFYAYDASAYSNVAGTVSFTVSFTSSEVGGETTEAPKAEYEVSQTALALGDNALTLLDTAVTTLFVFEPTETAVYTFTAPEGATLGYWGAGSWLLTDPNSTSNTYEWTCTGVGQKAYIGVSGVDGEFNLNVAKTGDYTVVETPIVKYENKATLEAFTIPEGAKLGGYVDVYGDTHTAVLGDDGYYHLDSVDGDVLLVDMDYQDIILSAALQSDRPVMYAYMYDADGKVEYKYDIGDAVKAYEAVMDANGYYPVTEDILLFYQVYAVQAGTYTFHVSGDYNEDCVWMYCMRTMNMDNVAVDPSEPEETEPSTEATEPSEPEVTEPSTEATEPSEEPSEPAGSGTVVLDASATAASGSKYTYKFVPETDGTLTVTVGDGTTNWVSDVYNMSAFKVVTSASGKAAGTYTAELVAGTTYYIRVSASTGALAATPVKAVFTPAGGSTEPSEPEVQKDPYAVSTTTLSVGSNTVSMIATAEATIFKFTPSEAGTYTITGPEGSKVGIWGYSSNLTDPNSTSNSCELNYANVGPTARVGVVGAEGQIVLTITKNAEPTEPSEPEVTEPEVTEPSQEPSVPESSEPEVTEPEVTEPSVPSIPDEDVPAGTYYSITVDGTTTYYSSSNGSTMNTALKKITGTGYVKFYQDMTLGTSYTVDVYSGDITIDLNGCTISSGYKAAGALYVSGGNVTVVDSSAAADGMFVNTSTNGFGVEIYSGSVTILSGGLEGYMGAKVWKGATFNVKGGTVTGSQYGINALADSTVNVSDGTIEQSPAGSLKYAFYAASTATVTVTGGNFSGTISGTGLNGKISGGYFTARPNATYVASGCSIEEVADSAYLYMVVDPNAPVEPEPSEPTEPETEPTEPSVPESSEPETEPTEPSVPESSEPETEPTEPSVPESSEPETEPTEPAGPETLLSLTDETVTATGYSFEYTAETDGTLTVTPGTCTPGYRYKVYGPGYESVYFTKWSASHEHEITAGTWQIVFYAYTSAQGNVDGKVSFDVTFTPAEGGGEVVKEEYQISDTVLQLGDNILTLLDTAITTLFVFEPTETAVYTFTAPDGTILGYWGAGDWFLTNPNSTTNTYEWTCTGVGQTAYIGVSGVDGEFVLTVAKTGDYEVVETPIVKYENKAELNAFAVPEGATLGAYVDVFGDTHTAVLGDDGYYHLDSADGPILLIDMDYMDIILSAALQSDRPVMYAYMYDEDGKVAYKYDIGDAVKAYEAVMDANGYYPVTEDILLFYQVYAVQAGTYTFHVSGDYNEDCVWMYCMRTMTLPEPAVAQVGDTQYATLAEAIAAANGNTVVLLADCADVTIAADVTIDLAGFSLTGVTVAEGATLYLVDSATDDYDGAYGTAEVTGNVASKVTVNGKNYLVVNEDGKYSAHCYALEITHVSLKPGDDALGYKAKLYGDAVVQSKVTGYGFNMGVVLQKTFENPGAPVNGEFTLRLKGIMAANGGDMEIIASAFVRFGDDVQTTEETKTTMKDTIKAVNNMELDDAQKAAVYALYAKYEAVMAGWFTAEETNNIATWAPQSSEAVPAE